MKRSLACAVLSVVSACAGMINVTGKPSATLAPGHELQIDFSVWNYGANNPGAPPYPTHLGLLIIGAAPGLAAVTLPDSTSQYYPGFLFEAGLESPDGDAWAPFPDPLLLAPGVFTQGDGVQRDVAVLASSLDLSLALSEAIFGQDLSGRIVLRNHGGAFNIGLGTGYTIRNSVLEPDVWGLGPSTVAGLTRQVTISNPEPSTALLVLGAALLAGLRGMRRRRAAAARRGSSQSQPAGHILPIPQRRTFSSRQRASGL
ncbi:MAG: hypothetical protein ABSD56_12815 [Bryobacteraceae bacterium]